jgi:surface carbohydrate biosynthesis protein
MKKILMLLHMPGRDSGFDSMLAHELKTRGHMVWLKQFLTLDRQSICIIKPDILYVPEIRNEYTRDICNLVRQWGAQVVIKLCEFTITEESIPFISEEYKNAIFGNINFNPSCDLVLGWGKKSVELVRKYCPVSAEKVVPCGGIAFDQYFTPIPPMERKPEKSIMFATGFAYADRSPVYSVPEAKHGEAIHRQFVESDRTGRSEWIKMIRAFLADERFKDWFIYIKPHAGEKQQIYDTIFRERVAHVSPIMPAFAILETVDVLIHAGSTMGYEAHLRNKPAFNYFNNCQDRIVAAISPNHNCTSDLFNAIETVELGKSNANPEIIKNMDDNYYGPVDGKAYIRAADAIELLPPCNPNIPDAWPPMTQFRYPDKDVLQTCHQWRCDGCNNIYYVTAEREMVKCPYCGIANVRIVVT